MELFANREAMETKARRMASFFFFVSGAAGLIYELVWVRLLGLVFGNTTFAVSTVLAAYMAGLGLGAYFLGRAADRWKRPILAYGLLELGIGVYAAFTYPLLKFIEFLYVHFAGQFHADFAALSAVRLLLSFPILFIPTFLMGGTFPVLAKFFTRKENLGSGVAVLYGLNTLGAVTGTVLTGFILLPALGLSQTLSVAVILNGGIGLLALILSLSFETTSGCQAPVYTPLVEDPPFSGGPRRLTRLFLLAGLFFSGAAAMLYEVAWTRALAAAMGSSTYAFTVMLAAFLLGIGLGSILLKNFLATRRATLLHWGCAQILIAAAAALALPLFSRVPIFVVRCYAVTLGHPLLFQAALFAICLLLMLVPAVGFGALFPLIASLDETRPQKTGGRIGALYLVNTFGNIAGSLAAGFILIPLVGIRQTIVASIAIGVLLGVCSALLDNRQILWRRGVVLGMALAIPLGWAGPMGKSWQAELLTSGIQMRPQYFVDKKTSEILAGAFNKRLLFYKEGLNSIVSVGQDQESRYLKVNGKTDASNDKDMITQLLLGHLPHLLHPDPKKTLVIGFGSGVTLAASLVHPIEEVDCVEIEPAVYEAAPLFDEINRRAYQDPRARLYTNDGRNHLLIREKTYDILISEPSNPWIAGVSNLFTVEFYRLAQKRLKAGGLLCQWVQKYSISPSDFCTVVASVQSVFPHTTLWTASSGDTLIVASQEPILFDIERIGRKFAQYPGVKEDLAPFEIQGAGGILSRFALGENDVKRLVGMAMLNTDNRLLLEYNTPKTLHEETAPLIEKMLENHRSEPMPSTRNPSPSREMRLQTILEEARGYLGMGEISKAKEMLRKLTEKNPENEEANLLLGRCWLEEQKYLQAAALLKNLASPEALHLLAFAMLVAGNPEEAAHVVEKAAEANPADWKTFSLQGDILSELGRWREAAKAYRRSIKLKKPNYPLRLNLARAERQSGRLFKAYKILQNLRREYPAAYSTYVELRETCEKLGIPKQAIKAYEELLTVNPYDPNLWLDLARLYKKSGDRQKSDRAYREAGKIVGY